MATRGTEATSRSFGQFIEELAGFVTLTETEQAILERANVRSYIGLLSLIDGYPFLANVGVNRTKLSGVALRHVPGPVVTATATIQRRTQARRRPKVRGARHPKGAPAGPGTPVSLSAPARKSPPLRSPKVIIPGVGAWPVKDQGDRGTCVAFAMAACREQLGGPKTWPTLSEQFLFWATKKYDPDPEDGSFLEHAAQALANDGICEDALWPYHGAPIAGNVTHASSPNVPSPSACADALHWRRAHSALTTMFPSAASPARAVLDALVANGRPVAISLPVYPDPTDPLRDNWNTFPGAELYGEVMDPPPLTASAIDGHAACVVGFTPDANERMGGYFVIRNSWGPNWATSLPDPSYHGPQAGYGQVSASYVDECLWEMCQL